MGAAIAAVYMPERRRLPAVGREGALANSWA